MYIILYKNVFLLKNKIKHWKDKLFILPQQRIRFILFYFLFAAVNKYKGNTKVFDAQVWNPSRGSLNGLKPGEIEND